MNPTLLLNATYEPLRLLPARRAVVLVLDDKADVLADGPGCFRSEHRHLPAPAVIRLRYLVRMPFRAHLPLNRRNLLARDRHRCAYCRRRADTVDHVVPRSRGGEHRWENVVAACRPCNAGKGNRLLAEVGWELSFTPSAPRGWGVVLLGASPIDPAWAPWLGLDPAASP